MRSISLLIALSIIFFLAKTSVDDATPPVVPKTVYWEAAHLVATKQALSHPDRATQMALSRLRKSAKRALKEGPYSVMQKEDVPPSGDKHDYASFARYWWPNPNTDDGLPYIRRDGKTNPEINSQGDRDSLNNLLNSVECLALAYYYFEDERYAEHASLLLRTWFLDADTKMNPNMNYAQAVKGRSEGRGVGILDTRGFILLLDAVSLLSESPKFSAENQRDLRLWFQQYLDWLTASNFGKEERGVKSNRGTWCVAQVARIAIYVGDRELARELVETVRTVRIPDQFQVDGSQPHEVGRTKSLHYSFFNLSALAVLARAGEHLEIDLWNDHTGKNADNNGSMQLGLSYLLPHLADQDEWPHQQMDDFQLTPQATEFLRMASVRYKNPENATLIDQVEPRYAKRNYAPLTTAAFASPVKE